MLENKIVSHQLQLVRWRCTGHGRFGCVIDSSETMLSH